MKKIKKVFIRTCLVFIILIPIAALAHYFVFPQESKSILIDYSNFKKEGRIYFNELTPQHKIDIFLLRRVFIPKMVPRMSQGVDSAD